ncbi:hypothetical protein OMAG_000634 [Candidatus Omnitrophus magneticus]|uniref:Uncharacterized protein n=1 Tax=Candidatus Omnitrophus magneticus TaxID=1609969 RepID=A0A0F0CTY4_9BACT|nr:hypothetical protein OMAG_000634 [Candidatus Omnitrophus magneticus]
MTALDTAGESTTIDGTLWNYIARDFNNAGFWGTGESLGSAWIDVYGFEHIYLNNSRGISTCAKPTELERIIAVDEAQFNSNWNNTEIKSLYDAYSTQTNASVDSLNWQYTNVAYSANGAWGLGKTIGNAWLDKYGFMHMYLNADEGMTTNDKTTIWNYIGKAGYSADFNEIFNEDWSAEEVQALYALYQAQSGNVTLNGIRWTYTSEEFSETQGKTLGDYWVSNNHKFIYLGSGLEGSPVPEIPGGMGLALLFGFGVSYLRRIKK